MPAIRSNRRSTRPTSSPISNQNRRSARQRLSSARYQDPEWVDLVSDPPPASSTSGDEFACSDSGNGTTPPRTGSRATARRPLRAIQPATRYSLKRGAKGKTNSLKKGKSKGRYNGRKIWVKGVELRPSVVFDTFWYFASERKAIDERRRAQQPWPWTEDPILRKYPFCNTYRVLDRTSQFIVREVIEKGPQDPVEITFRVVLFNMFTRIETWETLVSELGDPHLTWKDYKHENYELVLDDIKESGGSIYTGSFQKPWPSFERGRSNWKNHLVLLEVLMENELAWRLLNAKHLAEVYEWLVSFPSMGEFSTYQLMLNLLYSPVLNFSGNDFVVAGLGAVSGLQKIFGKAGLSAARAALPNAEEEIIRWFMENQDAEFKRLGLPFNGLGPDHIPLDLADVEHLLCEVDKYSRKRHPGVKGNDRVEIRGKYTPHDRPHPRRPTLPKAWSHPNRKLVRVWPRPPVVEKRYAIEKIVAHRTGSTGERQYYIYWEGYSLKDATWEFEASLVQDAPLMMESYKKAHGLR